MNGNHETRRRNETKPLKDICYHNHGEISLAISTAPAVAVFGYLNVMAKEPVPLAAWGLVIAFFVSSAYYAYFVFFPRIFIKQSEDSFALHFSSLRHGTYKTCIRSDEVIEISVEGLQHETEGIVPVDLDTNYYLRLKTQKQLDLPNWVADAVRRSKASYKRFRNDPDCVLMWQLGVVTPDGLDDFIALFSSRKKQLDAREATGETAASTCWQHGVQPQSNSSRQLDPEINQS